MGATEGYDGNEIYADSGVMGNLDEEMRAGFVRLGKKIERYETLLNEAQIDGPTKNAMLAKVARIKEFLQENQQYVDNVGEAAGEMKVMTEKLVSDLEDFWA